MGYVIGIIIWGIIWGFVTRTVNENKGYDGGFWLGFFLGFIGLIIVACKPVERTYYQDNDYSRQSVLSVAAREEDNKKVNSSGGWKCNKCGRVNPSYTGTCACGLTKYEVEAKMKEEAKAKETKEKELLDLQKLKMYKDLLDSGAISQDEFDSKKKQLLDL